MGRATRFVVMAGMLAGCRGSELEIARDLRADSTGVTRTLTPPIHARAGARALCLEFQPPGRSDRAEDLVLELTDVHGALDTLRSRLDRTGESTICFRDSLAVDRSFTALTVYSTQPIPIHRVAWSSPRDTIRSSAP